MRLTAPIIAALLSLMPVLSSDASIPKSGHAALIGERLSNAICAIVFPL